MPPIKTQYQGTWEEIKAHDAELTGQRVQLLVLDEYEPTPDLSELSPAERSAQAMREALELQKDMPFTKTGDSVAILREGRGGLMYGYEYKE